MRLSDKELLNIKGGFHWAIAALVTAVVTFVIGVIDGYLRPIKCSK